MCDVILSVKGTQTVVYGHTIVMGSRPYLRHELLVGSKVGQCVISTHTRAIVPTKFSPMTLAHLRTARAQGNIQGVRVSGSRISLG
jgi:hypothetical protein